MENSENRERAQKLAAATRKRNAALKKAREAIWELCAELPVGKSVSATRSVNGTSYVKKVKISLSYEQLNTGGYGRHSRRGVVICNDEGQVLAIDPSASEYFDGHNIQVLCGCIDWAPTDEVIETAEWLPGAIDAWIEAYDAKTKEVEDAAALLEQASTL